MTGPARSSTVDAAPVPRSLVDATPAEVGRYAVEYTIARYVVVSGTPRLLLARRVTVADLGILGFGRVGFTCATPPLVLAIIQGSFDVSTLFPTIAMPPRPEPAAYLVYVFDLRAGVPSLTMAERSDTATRRALSLAVAPEPSVATPPTRVATNPPCRYSAVAPTVVPPSIGTPARRSGATGKQ